MYISTEPDLTLVVIKPTPLQLRSKNFESMANKSIKLYKT